MLHLYDASIWQLEIFGTGAGTNFASSERASVFEAVPCYDNMMEISSPEATGPFEHVNSELSECPSIAYPYRLSSSYPIMECDGTDAGATQRTRSSSFVQKNNKGIANIEGIMCMYTCYSRARYNASLPMLTPT
jgi:hypothetical protein